MEWIELAQDSLVVGCCEHGDELRASINNGEFLAKFA
jgi:hypothetical protein